MTCNYAKEVLQALLPWAGVLAISTLIVPASFGQVPGLSIANYQLVGSQTIRGMVTATYRADIVNTGAALGSVTATVTSSNPAVLQVVAGQDTLQFAPVPANSQVTSSNTLTLETSGAIDLTQLQWSFQTASVLVPANVTVAVGGTVNYPVALGVAAPAGGVFITLVSSSPAAASVSPYVIFVPEGQTVAPRTVAVVTGSSAGTISITASAPGYAAASGQLQVTGGTATAPTMSFWPGSLTVNQGTAQNLTLNLSAPATAALAVNLGSTDATVATVPVAVSFATGATSVSVPVTGVAAGSVTITASAPGMASAAATATVPQAAAPAGILLPAGVTVASGNSVNFPVTLATAAPAGGVSITLASSNTSIASVWPSSFFITGGSTTSRDMPVVTGGASGSATITASASGFPNASAVVQVTGGAAPPPPTSVSMSFSTASLTINGSGTQDLTLNLSAPAASTFAVSLTSSDATVATVPAAVSFATGASSLEVPVTAVGAGAATVTASATGAANATARVTVTQAAAGGILLSSGVTLTAGSSVNFPVALGAAAPAGGLTITLASTDSSVATVWPLAVFIPQGATASRATVTVTGAGGGSASITASAFGYPTASTQVQVTGAAAPPPPPVTMYFSPTSLTINGSGTQNLTLNLSAPAAAALAVTLSSSNLATATVPATVSFGMGASSISVPVTAVAAGTATVTASAANVTGATAGVTVTAAAPPVGAISLPPALTVGVGQSLILQVGLPAQAPAGGVTVTLSSSSASNATVTASVFIAAGVTGPATPPQISGVSAGTATITASAPGYTPGTVQIQVTGVASGGSFFAPPGGLTVNAGITQNLSLNLSAAGAAGLVASLGSSDPTVATVPATVTFPGGTATVSVPVTGVGAGTTTITASIPGFGTASTTATVASLAGVSINWYGACWATLTISGFNGNFQAIDFALTTPAPVVINGSLFFSANCDPSSGPDNMNDNGATTSSTHMIQGFTHFPNVIPTSAMYWIGNATSVNGLCPAGSLCSGCVSYTQATPNCSNMP